jgi:acetoin utilization protein AcuB
MTISVESFMTRNPLCIDAGTPFGEAYRLMRDREVRHLPVLAEGRLAGLLSQRDLLRLESQANIDRAHDPVSDAMTQAPYVVAPSAEVAQVVAEMARRKLGSAVVVEKNKVVGIFTTTDALHAFAALLRRESVEERRESLAPLG